MDKVQKEILRKAVEYRGGVIPIMVFRNMTGGDGKSANALIATKYIDEVPARTDGKTYTAYRATEKGYLVFAPYWKRLWVFFSNDMAKILSIIAIVISILVGLKQIGLL